MTIAILFMCNAFFSIRSLIWAHLFRCFSNFIQAAIAVIRRTNFRAATVVVFRATFAVTATVTVSVRAKMSSTAGTCTPAVLPTSNVVSVTVCAVRLASCTEIAVSGRKLCATDEPIVWFHCPLSNGLDRLTNSAAKGFIVTTQFKVCISSQLQNNFDIMFHFQPGPGSLYSLSS